MISKIAPKANDVSATDSSFLRNFELLETIAASPAPLSIETIANITGLPKSTAHRLVRNLVDSRILMLEANGRHFAPGSRLHAIAITVSSNSKLNRLRHEVIANLVNFVGHTCNFTTFATDEVVYVDRVEAKWPSQVSLLQGSRVPLHCTSSGKLFLSYMPARQRRRLLFTTPLQRFTKQTITDPKVLEQELKKIRKASIAVDDGGYIDGMISIAVPVRSQRKKVIGCVAVHANRANVSPEEAFLYLPELKRAARELGAIYKKLG